MGRKKTFLKMPKLASIKCTNCQAVSKRKVPEDASPQYFDCDKCQFRTKTPITGCCIICAFTGEKCIPALKMEARIKGLELR